MIGRFLAYKALNAAWRSATRTGSGHGPSTPKDDAELVSSVFKTILFFLAAFALIVWSTASCVSGSAGMIGLGLILFWMGIPAVYVSLLFLPDRWFKGRKSTVEDEATMGKRVKIQIIATSLIMLLGIGSCVAGNVWVGMTIFWIVSTVVFVAISLAPNHWFGVQPFHTPKPAALTHNARPMGNRSRSVLDQPTTRGGAHPSAKGPTPIASGDYADEQYDKEAARRAAHGAAYGGGGVSEAAAQRRAERLRLLNRLCNMTAEDFQAEYAASENNANWMQNRWAYYEVARKREQDAQAKAHSATTAPDKEPVSVEPIAEKPYVVYFIQAKGGDGECKVGITRSLQSRLRSLQTGNPHELEAVHTIRVDDKAAAEQIEDAVLNAIRNAGAELTGEWFQSAILPWARQVAETERKRIES